MYYQNKNSYSLLSKVKPSDEAVVKLMFDFVCSGCDRRYA